MFLDWSLHDLNDLLYVDPPGGSRNPKEIPVEIHTNGCECTEYHLKDKYVTVSIGKMAFRCLEKTMQSMLITEGQLVQLASFSGNSKFTYKLFHNG